ncbi:MAG: D-alanine--D-alanine ligase, partial [Kiritimatiellales bacterium]|nr:D-alanine--D-alanine ligase [Kiritimatiellales bacterium]
MGRTFNKVAVLKGGISSEREVSLRSGAAIAQGLRDGGYDVFEIDIVAKDFSLPEWIEAVFIALHGEFGEDGEIQQLLSDKNIPFTGSGAASCRVSFDKVLTRNCLQENGVSVPRGELIEESAERTIDFPLVVKPPREGSSVGCHIVSDAAHWVAAFSDAAGYSGQALVEEYIPGRELTVGIVDGEVLPVVEIKPAAEWYDFEAKYVTGDTEYIVPAVLEKDMAARLQ